MRLPNITVQSDEKFKVEEICNLNIFLNWLYVHILVFPHG